MLAGGTVGENTAREAGVTRQQADEWAFHSHQRAAAAVASGRFDDEIVTVPVADGQGGTRLFERDEHPRSDTTIERLASLPVLHPELPNATVTAGNAGGLDDAAAAVMLMSDDAARDHGATPVGCVAMCAGGGMGSALVLELL